MLTVNLSKDVFISNPVWYCGLCLEPINDESESSIICDSCLTWYHFHFKSFPKTRFWFLVLLVMLCLIIDYSVFILYSSWFYYCYLHSIRISTPTALGVVSHFQGVVSITGTIALNYMSSYISIGTALHQHLNSIEP